MVVRRKCGILNNGLLLGFFEGSRKRKEAVKVKLKQLLEGISYEVQQGTMEMEISDFQYDSRKVEKDSLFVCITGFQTDGHKYIPMAVEKGAAALLCEYKVEGVPEGVAVIVTENNRAALAVASANFYGYPSKEMNAIGVTGTNGKTSTTYLMKSILDRVGKKVGIVGTIENRIGDKVLKTERTTPESKELQALFRQMKDEGVTDVAMEVSSHSLDLHRVDGIDFDIAIFTNLTQDHLDYHKTMENYKAAKGLLFERAAKSVINMDDAAGAYMKEHSKGEVLTIGVDTKADLMAENIDISAEGTAFDMIWQGKKYPVHLHTPGRFSVYNALGAAGACLLLGVAVEDVVAGLTENPGVSGRFQTVRSKKGCQAVVDYAHTPDGLENVLNTANEFVKGKLIAVFGCGGDRDRTKRPIMGEIGGKLAGYCIITSDNPRTEDPEAILEDVEAGVKKTDCPYEKIVDRRTAIQRAVELAGEGDVILIAGKGHETYQIFPDRTIHFDDMEEVRKAFGEDCL